MSTTRLQPMSDRLRAEYEAEMAGTRAAERFVPRPPPKPKPRRTPSPPPVPESEAELAARLLAFVNAESPIDREAHARAVARMILGAAGKSRLG